MYLKELSKEYFTDRKECVFVFPVGATEQHGPFLPFGTDTYITDYIVDKIEKKFPELIVLPTLEVSRSREHRGYYGTLWLEEDTLKQVLLDICTSLQAQAKTICLLSFHANDAVFESFIKSHGLDCTVVHIDMIHDDDDTQIEALLDGPVDDHAGNSEISNMLALQPNLVTVPDNNYPKVIIKEPWHTGNLADISKNGIADNHRSWNVDKIKGQKILDIYAARAITNITPFIS